MIGWGAKVSDLRSRRVQVGGRHDVVAIEYRSRFAWISFY
jgi:hypothetical protein